MELRLYNTLTRTKEAFRPLDPARVRMYVCGPTVYDRAHIGNARPVIVFDVLFRLLRHLYGPEHVTYVRNITDVDDKINARAAERGVPIGELTKTTYEWFQEDVRALGCLPPTHEPRATQYVAQMIAMIETLIAARHAYVAQGHVLFDVASKPDYGKLSNRSLDDMIAGARVEVAPYKKNPMDFVLWKPSTPELPGWDSPWGRGRPGWHIECSAMGEALLGPTFDIHGGGIDLVFPHHENEVAQSECAHGGAPLAQVWMHNGFLQVEGEKMAKSVGNFITIHEMLEFSRPHDIGNETAWKRVRNMNGALVRLGMLMTNYRQPLDWTGSRMNEATIKLADWRAAIRGAKQATNVPETIVNALCDDLNSHLAISEMDRLAKKARSGSEPARAANELFAAMHFLGFESQTEGLEDDGSLKRTVEAGFRGIDETRVEALIVARNTARKAKDFQEADRIRDQLKGMGVELEDKKDGTTTWEVAR
jgi:cysteinyl-tRNA synthetase